jgi:hypothetical protein
MIYVNVPWAKVDPGKKFLPEFTEWYGDNKRAHDLRLNFQICRPLYEIQGETVHKARKAGASHILFVEDDHWAFPEDGLDVLLEADKDAIGFQTFRKVWPYSSLAMKRDNPNINLIGPHQELLDNGLRLMPHNRDGGEEVQETGVITWAFTLVKMSVFDRLKAAGLDPFQQQGPVPTDSYFAQYCSDLGIPLHVHFGWAIAHGQHDPRDLPLVREIETDIRQAKKNQIAMLMQPNVVVSEQSMADKLEAFHVRNQTEAA